MRDFDDNEFPLAYLITFRCYGTWLHGDERGSYRRSYGDRLEGEGWTPVYVRVNTGLPIVLDADGHAAGQVPADLGKLRQMLLNLVSNAVKFTPEGGRVSIDALRLDEAVEILVSDTGIGIAEGDRVRLFEPFRQLDSTISRQQHGTGLGLALTKRFAELHGGQLRVDSELGKGSVFTLRLPLKPRGAEVPVLVHADPIAAN